MLIGLQKRAIRIICDVGWRDPTSYLFQMLKVLKMTDLVKYQTCIHMFKANRGSLPENVQCVFKKGSDVHKYSTRNKHNFYIESVRSEKRKMSINVKGVSLWNELSETIKGSKSLNKFKSKLKSKFLSCY